MSFCETSTLIKEGDIAIVFVSFNAMYPIKVKSGLSHHTKYGGLKHSDMIDKKYGTQFLCSAGTVYVLQADPNLWTKSLPHRTQILYTHDISLITLQLELKPGSVVIESGTGSASLSHHLIRTVYPSGHLHTFEFHKERSEKAREEFKEHGMSDYVTVYHRDVCETGFGAEQEGGKLHGVANAVFLDLPSPWKALASARDALQVEGGRICSFSPCIEQVQKTSLEMSRLGFTNINTVESLRRVLCVKKHETDDFDFSLGTVPKLNKNKQKAEEKAEEEEEEEEEEQQQQQQQKQKSSLSAKKKSKQKGKEYWKKNRRSEVEELSDEELSEDNDENGNDSSEMKTIYAAKPINIQPGHTGFLTFATLLHKEVFGIVPHDRIDNKEKKENGEKEKEEQIQMETNKES